MVAGVPVALLTVEAIYAYGWDHYSYFDIAIKFSSPGSNISSPCVDSLPPGADRSPPSARSTLSAAPRDSGSSAEAGETVGGVRTLRACSWRVRFSGDSCWYSEEETRGDALIEEIEG